MMPKASHAWQYSILTWQSFFAVLQSAALWQYLCTTASILVPNSRDPGLFGLCSTGEAEVVQLQLHQCKGPTVLVFV